MEEKEKKEAAIISAIRELQKHLEKELNARVATWNPTHRKKAQYLEAILLSKTNTVLTLFEQPHAPTSEDYQEIRQLIESIENIIHTSDPKLAKVLGIFGIAVLAFALFMFAGYGIGLLPAMAAWVSLVELFQFLNTASVLLITLSSIGSVATACGGAYAFFKPTKLDELVDVVKSKVPEQNLSQIPSL